MPLAGQLIHQRPVRPGPLVLGTTPLKLPTPVADRDRQCCYSRAPNCARGSGHFCLTLHVAMQLGLYLPGLAALSGVQSLRILEGYELFSIVLAGSVRLRSSPRPPLEACGSRRVFDGGREPLLERCERTFQSPPASSKARDTARRTGSRALVAPRGLEPRGPARDRACCSVALHRDREAAFSVDVSCYVAVQSFLLIVRTRHVVTIVNVWPDVTMSSAGFTEFPAYGRIYRQQGHLLSHDVLTPARVPL